MFDAAATPQGEIVERSAEAMLDRFCGYTGSTKTGIAAQPSPVKEKVQAQWLRQDNYEDASYKVFCSNCFKLNGKNTLDECPNCGAKMVDVSPGLSKGG